MKAILSLIISGALVVSGLGQTRNVLVGTNNTVVQPTNFWSADASNARSGLGLGTAATNPASAFQPSSGVLSNLASSNAVNLTNLRATNLVGVIPSSNIPTTTLTNISGTLAIVSGGTGATNASNARVNLGATTVGDALFISTNAAAARTAIEALATNGDATNLTNFPALLLRTNGSASGLTNFPTVPFASNVTGTIAISNGGSGAATAGGARTNLGLGATWLTNTVASNFRTAIGATTIGNALFTATNSAAAIDAIGISTNFSDQILSVSNIFVGSFTVGSGVGFVTPTAGGTLVLAGTNVSSGTPAFFGWDGFMNSAFSAAQARTNIGLSFAALTNTNTAGFNTSLYGSGTNPVLYNTNGEVVSPTNFWQVAPIVTRFVEFQPSTNATTNIVAARNLHIHSLALAITGVTSTIALPTNNVFNGDIALVVHEGPTSSVTQVRTQGSTNNLVTMNRTEEAVEFVYYNSVWQFNHNQAFVEPIVFSGTNAAANAAASRTNLGLGAANDVQFNTVNTRGIFDGTNEVIDVENNWLNYIGFGATFEWNDAANTTYVPFAFGGTNAALNAAATRTNLGLGLPALTNTNNAGFRTAIELGETNNVSFSNVTASGTLTATSTVTAKTNLVVEGHLDFTTNATNSNPATNNQIQDFIEIRVGTNQYWLPIYK